MKIMGTESNQAILKEMGIRIRQRRIALATTQKSLSDLIGISLRTITNIENGENASFDNIISLLKALKLINNLDVLIPESKIDPLIMLKQGHERKRVSKRKIESNWKWGDEK